MLNLNYRDSRPIYEQVRDELRKLVISGAISPDDKLPSVRSLARSLAINPNTIQKAYEALEHEGYVYTISGRGTFVSPHNEIGSEQRKKLWTTFDETVSELRFLGVSLDELKFHLDALEQQPKPNPEQEGFLP